VAIQKKGKIQIQQSIKMGEWTEGEAAAKNMNEKLGEWVTVAIEVEAGDHGLEYSDTQKKFGLVPHPAALD